MQWDVTIVGAGAAGLFVGCKLLEAHPTLRVLLLEKYNYVGGRMYTFKKHLANRDLQWESGAGRLSMKHWRLLGLLRKYDLHLAGIDSLPDVWLKSGDAPTVSLFQSIFPLLLQQFAALSPATLATHTLADLMRKTGNEAALPLFPYWSELHTLRADLALETFLHGEFSGKERFCVVAEGFGALAQAMAAEFERRGGFLQKGATVLDVRSVKTKRGESLCQLKVLQEGLHTDVVAKTCVLATHLNALRSMPSVRRHMPVLRHLQMEPLVRMYAVFPVIDGEAWFSGLPRMVTAGRVRYILPISDKKGVIMISYTDGADARYWIDAQKRHGDAWVQEEVLRDVRALFLNWLIPDPHVFKIHPWSSGCTYWRPGAYNVKKAIMEGLEVGGGIFACGESLSLRQAWVEGALESAEALLELPAFASRFKKTE